MDVQGVLLSSASCMDVQGVHILSIASIMDAQGVFFLSPAYALQGKFHLCIPFLGMARLQSQFPHSCVCELFVYSHEGLVHIFPCSRKSRPILEIYKSLRDTYMSVGTGRQHIIILFWK
jgi:hypothetical protein